MKIHYACCSFLFLIVFYFGCRKNKSRSPFSARLRIAGSWTLHGADEKSVYSSMGYVYTHDTVVENVVITAVDSSIIVLKVDSVYTVFTWLNSTDSTESYVSQSDGSHGGDIKLTYNPARESLVYDYCYNAGMGGWEHESLVSSPGQTPATYPKVTSAISKLVGAWNWHGTERDYYYGLIDTTFNEQLKIQLYALSDSVLLSNHIGYVPVNAIYQYYVYRKVKEDANAMIFQEQYSYSSTYSIRGIQITYNFADKSMIYNDYFFNYGDTLNLVLYTP